MIFQHTRLRGLTSVFGMGTGISPRVDTEVRAKERGQSLGSGPDGLILMLIILPSGGEEYRRVRLLRNPVAAGWRARVWVASPIRRAARCRRAMGRETALT